MYVRGVHTKTATLRSLKTMYLERQSEVTVFDSLFLFLKLKSFDARVAELAAERGNSTERAAKRVRKNREALPQGLNDSLVYLRLFKDIPVSDLDMILPLSRVRISVVDKLKLGVTGGVGVAGGVASTATKVAAAATPFGLLSALGGLVAVSVKQVQSVFRRRNLYHLKLARLLYFHNIDSNLGALTRLLSSAEDQELKEMALAYTLLRRAEPDGLTAAELDRQVEARLAGRFGVRADFEVEDALGDLGRTGLLVPAAGARYRALEPHAAFAALESRWDALFETDHPG